MILVCATHCSKCVTFISLNCESHNDCQSHYADNAMKAQRDQVPSPWLYSCQVALTETPVLDSRVHDFSPRYTASNDQKETGHSIGGLNTNNSELEDK